jgi:hypothetical protein
VTEGECSLVGGDFQGVRVPCLAALCAPACPGDVNGDGTVGLPDLLIVLSDWGPSVPCPPFIPADVDRSCAVDDADLAIVLDAWGPCAFGACCTEVGACIEVREADCVAFGGLYRGDGSLCELVICASSSIPLGPPREFATYAEPTTEAVAFVDADGFRDVIVLTGPPPGAGPTAPGSIQLCRNEGTGPKGWLGFEVDPPVETGDAPAGVLLARLNDDVFNDVAVCNGGDNTVHVFLNDGNGGFGAPIVIALPELDEPSAIGAADFTGDGRIDLAVANFGNDTIVLLENLGTPLQGPAFGLRQVVSVPDDPAVIDPEDVDNDRDVDLVGSTKTGGKAAVVMNQGTGLVGDDVFLPPLLLPLGNEPVGIAGGDLDGNGFVDIIAVNRADDTVKIIFNVDGHTFDLSFAPLPVGDIPRSVDVGDLDGDGDLDIVIAVDDPVLGPAIQAIENVEVPGGIAFAIPLAKSVGGDPNFVRVRDIDGDGLADVTTVNSDDGPSGGSVTVLLQLVPLPACAADIDDNGAVDFLDLLILLASWGPCPGCPADIDRDGTVGAIDLAIMVESWGPCT